MKSPLIVEPPFQKAVTRRFEVFDLGFCRVGTLICYDVSFSEAWRIMALKGAEVVHRNVRTSRETLGILGADIPAIAPETTAGDLVIFNQNLKHRSQDGGSMLIN